MFDSTTIVAPTAATYISAWDCTVPAGKTAKVVDLTTVASAVLACGVDTGNGTELNELTCTGTGTCL